MMSVILQTAAEVPQNTGSGNFFGLLVATSVGAVGGFFAYKNFIGKKSQEEVIELQEKHSAEKQKQLSQLKDLEMELKEKDDKSKNFREEVRKKDDQILGLQEKYEDLKEKALKLQNENKDFENQLRNSVMLSKEYQERLAALQEKYNELNSEN